ncbi:MAG: hypothetical protein NT039_04835 [Candidatus Berkelbacteria bacterium]|nr:hypothetical protein [Candidatus Berkelbacteria bacterium]
MNIDEKFLKFPQTLPNDLEAFMVFYPNKFPPIISYYEKIAHKIANDPEAYHEYGDWAQKELFAGFEKIEKDYKKGDQNNLAFLVETDQRLHKLFCYRFWPVNYLFADGPLHDFFVDNLKNLIHKFIDVADEVEEFEGKVFSIQRDLLQGDYADLYLRQAIEGVKIIELLEKNQETKKILKEARELIKDSPQQNLDKINLLWGKIAQIIQKEKNNSELKKKFDIPLAQAKMRKTMLPFYNMLTHAVEFQKENEQLTKRHKEMGKKIDSIMDMAKGKLLKDDFELFKLSYEQARNFSMYKDVMGEIDLFILPLWFGLHDKVKKILSKTMKLRPRSTGHSAMFYYLVWYLPTELKAKVISIDETPFDLKTL